jgi:hypothetical protein
MGAPTFEYGKFGIPINTSPPPLPDPSANTPVKFGAADSGSYNPLTGVIRLTLSKSKFRAIDGGSTKYNVGSDLAGFNARTYFNRPDPGQRSQNNASDITDDSSYSIVGNNSCAPAAQLVSAVSRKIHGTAGTFDVRLLPPDAKGGIECRRDASDIHHVVFTFAVPVTFTGATASGTHGIIDTSPAPGSTPASEVTVNLTGVANQQNITVNLLGVTAGGAAVTVSVPMSVLQGDVNANRTVSNGDVSLVKAQVSYPVDDGNFRNDVNANGVISNGDVSITKGNVPTQLPP